MPITPTAGPMFGEDTLMQVSDGGSGTPGGTFADIADLISIDPPSNKTPVVERKLLGVPSRKVNVPGNKIDPGMMTFSCETKFDQFDRLKRLQFPTSITDPNDDRHWSFRVWYRDGTRFSFIGFVTDVKADKVEGGKVTEATVTVCLESLVGLEKVTRPA